MGVILFFSVPFIFVLVCVLSINYSTNKEEKADNDFTSKLILYAKKNNINLKRGKTSHKLFENDDTVALKNAFSSTRNSSYLQNAFNENLTSKKNNEFSFFEEMKKRYHGSRRYEGEKDGYNFFISESGRGQKNSRIRINDLINLKNSKLPEISIKKKLTTIEIIATVTGEVIFALFLLFGIILMLRKGEIFSAMFNLLLLFFALLGAYLTVKNELMTDPNAFYTRFEWFNNVFRIISNDNIKTGNIFSHEFCSKISSLKDNISELHIDNGIVRIEENIYIDDSIDNIIKYINIAKMIDKPFNPSNKLNTQI